MHIPTHPVIGAVIASSAGFVGGALAHSVVPDVNPVAVFATAFSLLVAVMRWVDKRIDEKLKVQETVLMARIEALLTKHHRSDRIT